MERVFVRRQLRAELKSKWVWVQIISGLYLILFLLVHTSAAFLTRTVFHLDTNFYWIAGTLLITPIKWGFAPYYFLAVVSFLTHIAAALHIKNKKKNILNPVMPAIIICLSVILAGIIVAVFSGVFYDINLPDAYKEYFKVYTNIYK